MSHCKDHVLYPTLLQMSYDGEAEALMIASVAVFDKVGDCGVAKRDCFTGF